MERNMATKLNQIIAVEKGVKNRTERDETNLYHLLDKKQPFAGLSRVYTRNDDEGDQLPSEGTAVQAKAEDVIDQYVEAVTRLVDITATKDVANTTAKADIKIGDHVIAAQVPVTTLLFLEKQLDRWSSLIGRLPVLPADQDWHYDSGRSVYVSDPVERTRSKKVPKTLVKYEATEHHPAQTEVFTEDIIVGTWRQTDFSGALEADRVAGIKSRLEQLRTAVKFAREEANCVEVVDVKPGEALLDFVFKDNGGSPQVSG